MLKEKKRIDIIVKQLQSFEFLLLKI